MKKKNIVLSDSQAEWIKQKSEELGVPQTTVISLAITNYIDQQTALKEISKVDSWIKQLENLKDQKQ